MIRPKEQETVIQYDPIDDVVHVFSTMPNIVKKYRRIAAKFGFTLVRDEGDLIEVDIPKGWFSVTVKKPYVQSEEQRAAAAERLRKYHFAKREAAELRQTPTL